MTLQQLQYFLAAARHGSFSAAASRLYMAQPSLSEQIRRLEDELGTPLFVRGVRGLQLTPAGERLRPYAERALEDVEEGAAAVREVRELRGGEAAFGTIGRPDLYGFGEIARAFRLRYPDVRLRLVGENSAEVADAVRDGRLEAGVVALPIDDRGLDVRPALQDEIFFVSTDPAALKRPMTIEKLAERDLILFDVSWGTLDPSRRQLAERAQRAGVRLDPVIDVEEVEIAHQLAAEGLGDSIASKIIMARRRFPKRLGHVRFAEPLYDTLAFITRRNAVLSPASRELLALAEESVARLAA